jgi:hypothetical protein
MIVVVGVIGRLRDRGARFLTARKTSLVPVANPGVRTELQTIEGWRERELRRAGFAPPLAAAVAREGGYDLHALLDLVGRGCAPELAVRILAPLDGPPEPAA